MTGKKKGPGDFIGFIQAPTQDLDLQAGSMGISAAEAAKRYLKSPGHFLAVLRFFEQESPDQVSSATHIAEKRLNEFEKGSAEPTLDELTQLAEHFGADLRLLLEVFGHVEEGAAKESMGIAAQFGGQLSEAEKLDLRKLVQAFSKKEK